MLNSRYDARGDLSEIREYIASGSIDAADRIIGARAYVPIIAVSGCPELPDRLCAERKPLWAVAVPHGKRSPRVLAFILRERT